MEYTIANVKVSVKTSAISLDIVIKDAEFNNLYCKNYKNFIVLKNNYTYIIFKQNKNNENHINITKIPSLELVDNAILLIKSIATCNILSYKIDNIIASTVFNRNIDLQLISKSTKGVKYNNEKFPGLFLKSKCGTAILFYSGKIVIVGSKTKEDIECLLTRLFVDILMK